MTSILAEVYISLFAAYLCRNRVFIYLRRVASHTLMQAKTHRCPPYFLCSTRRHNLLLRSNHVASARCRCISCGRRRCRRGRPSTTESGYTLFLGIHSTHTCVCRILHRNNTHTHTPEKLTVITEERRFLRRLVVVVAVLLMIFVHRKYK